MFHLLDRRFSEHEDRIKSLHANHEERMRSLRVSHEERIRSLHASHDERIRSLHANHEESIMANIRLAIASENEAIMVKIDLVMAKWIHYLTSLIPVLTMLSVRNNSRDVNTSKMVIMVVVVVPIVNNPKLWPSAISPQWVWVRVIWFCFSDALPFAVVSWPATRVNVERCVSVLRWGFGLRRSSVIATNGTLTANSVPVSLVEVKAILLIQVVYNEL
ncbi:hypothetical protein L484_021944 [Morus notabilis]|uniref:Uncharacterized protein n=1 Tax=Morus notabilis TaxID=981085 RepID=W9R8Z2_9ROSA|nr:hypothetical protein L484_021944 [Morus notabilis]